MPRVGSAWEARRRAALASTGGRAPPPGAGGNPLSIVETSAAPVLRSVANDEQSVGDEFVGKLSERGRKRFEALKDRCGGTARARVHEIFVHLQRDSEGRVTRRSLVVLPTIIVEAS